MQRISLGVTQPLVAMAAALLLVVMFLGAAILAQSIRMDRLSAAETQAYARLASEALAGTGEAGLVAALEDVAGDRFVLVDHTGRIVGGNGELLQRSDTKSAPVMSGGQETGRIVTHRLRSFRFALPFEATVVLIAIALLTAYAIASFYTRFVLAGLKSIERVLARTALAEPAPEAAGFTFTEITRLQMLVDRRLREARRTQERLRQAAFQNAESGLPNLHAFSEALDQQLANADFDHPLCVFALDIDHFQKVSEILGLEHSGALLSATTERIEQELAAFESRGLLNRRQCMFAHLQGDEFALLLPPGTGRDTAALVARNLRRAFVAPFVIDCRRVTLGLSGGIAIAPEDGDRVAPLLRRANAALRGLRNEGREGFVFYQSRLDRVTEKRLLLEADIRQALDEKAYWPAFQPKIDLTSGAITGCEALARWTRRDGTMVSPGEFIAVAEQSGLIVEIGDTILRQSCQAAAAWVRDGWRVPVAVNVSAAQLDDPTFCDRVLNAIAESGLEPGLLELEITESMAVRDPVHVEAVLKPLRRMGVRLAIDDFGTGHANLAIITRLNFDVFKIDRSFVSRLTTDSSGPAVVSMILAMARTLRHVTVAEGVETAEQLAFLRESGCTLAQGFYFCGPVPEMQFREVLKGWSPVTVTGSVRKSA